MTFNVTLDLVTKNGVAKIISIQQEDGNGLDEIKEDNTAAGKNYQDLKEGRNSIYKQDSSMTFGLTRAVSNLLIFYNKRAISISSII